MNNSTSSAKDLVDAVSLHILLIQSPAYTLSTVLSLIDILASFTTFFGMIFLKIGSTALRIYFSGQLVCEAGAMFLNLLLNFYHFYHLISGVPETMKVFACFR